MYENLMIFKVAGSLANHAAGAQKLTATNMANADTPGYRALEAKPFDADFVQPQAAVRTSRSNHISTLSQLSQFQTVETNSEASPNGNTVSIEEQMVSAYEAQRAHSRALAIYRHGMTVLRTAMGR